jgi:hypothetical protein
LDLAVALPEDDLLRRGDESGRATLSEPGRHLVSKAVLSPAPWVAATPVEFSMAPFLALHRAEDADVR